MKKIKTFEEKCYEKYKLHWMLTHGWTLTDLYDIFVGLAAREIEEEPMHIPTDENSVANMAQMLKEMFLTEDGFGSGSLYACFDEFMTHEFEDRAYMESLFRLVPGFEENMKKWEEATGCYHAEISVRPGTAAYIRKLMTVEPKSESDCFGEGETITLTAEFSDGYEADIKVCGVRYEEGGNNTAWAEAVLYFGGREEFVSEPVSYDDFFGTWELYGHGGEVYTVDIVEMPAASVQNKEERLEVETSAGTIRAYKSQCPGEPGITVMFQPKGQDDEIDIADLKVIEDKGCQTEDRESPEDLVFLAYGSPFTEDYTTKYILRRQDVCEALGIKEK